MKKSKKLVLCSDHPRYGAKRKPRSVCKTCWWYWTLVVLTKRTYEFVEEKYTNKIHAKTLLQLKFLKTNTYQIVGRPR